jgi:hypothetical protein
MMAAHMKDKSTHSQMISEVRTCLRISHYIHCEPKGHIGHSTLRDQNSSPPESIYHMGISGPVDLDFAQYLQITVGKQTA